MVIVSLYVLNCLVLLILCIYVVLFGGILRFIIRLMCVKSISRVVKLVEIKTRSWKFCIFFMIFI